MSTDIEGHMVAHPGEAALTTSPGQPETRNDHGNMDDAELARFRSRRRFLRGAAGAGALFLTGGIAAVVAATRDGSAPEQADTTSPNMGVEAAGPAFEKDLALRSMTAPETLDAPTFELVVANYAQALQFAVNTNDEALIRRLVPGGQAGMLQPGQFELRADFIAGYRESSRGTANDDPNNPDDPRYYPWGFNMELVEQLSRVGDNPTDADVTNFMAKVKITMGDLPPLTTSGASAHPIEPPRELITDVEFTRFGGYEGGRFTEVPDINGTDGRGWALANASQMYGVPKIMTGLNLPKGYTEVPELFERR